MLTDKEKIRLRTLIGNGMFGQVTPKLLEQISLLTDEEIRAKLAEVKDKVIARINANKTRYEGAVVQLNAELASWGD